jgi:2-polyprenyl-6-methoxyphenol hydroxylase-like FAD-dependent oxidoreductase
LTALNPIAGAGAREVHPMRNASVLICGAGIAGCTLAYWLSRQGFKPTLIERSPRLRTGGYIIDFWGLGYDIAERMGLLPALERRAYDVTELRFVDHRAKRVGGFEADVFRKLTRGRFLSLPRGDLTELLFRTIEPSCEVIFGDSVSAIADTPMA